MLINVSFGLGIISCWWKIKIILYLGNPSKTAASVASSQKSRFNRDRDDTQQQEASERRRIWAMAAASAAEMIKELNQKDPPQFDSVTKVFAPISNESI